MPYHSLSFPIPYYICTLLNQCVLLDPHEFIRERLPGKALYVFTEKMWHSEAYVDVFAFSPTDLSVDTFPDQHPLWVVTRFFGSEDPFLFWKSARQQYLGFAEPGHSPTLMLQYFVDATAGLPTLESWLSWPGDGGSPAILC